MNHRVIWLLAGSVIGLLSGCGVDYPEAATTDTTPIHTVITTLDVTNTNPPPAAANKSCQTECVIITDGDSSTDSAESDATTTDPPAIVIDGDSTAPSESTRPSTEPVTSTEPPPGETPCQTNCVIVVDGDSQPKSFLYSPLWKEFCAALNQTVCQNTGIAGFTTGELAKDVASRVDIHASSGPNDVYVLWSGTNDLLDGRSAEDTYSTIDDFVESRRIAGWDTVVVLTHPPLDPGRLDPQTLQRFNDLLRQNGAGADFVIDIAGDAVFSDPFDQSLRQADGIHYKEAGNRIVVEDYLLPILQS